MRKHTAILTMMLLLAAASAHGGAPESQFCYSGWPYRQPAACENPVCTHFPTDRPENGPESTALPTVLPGTPTPQPVVPTQAPAVPPEAAPTAQPTRQPAGGSSTDEDYTTDSLSAQEQKALNLLNSDRKNNGLPALEADPALSAIARAKSEDMRDRGYFAHESPTYGSPSEMLKHFGYSFRAAAENIAHHATVEKAQTAFMSSEGHRRNALSASWTKVGLGVSRDRNGYVYVTQLFVR